MATRPDWLLVGTIQAPFGIHGEVKVGLWTDFPERFAPDATVYLGARHRPIVVERAHPHGGGLACKFRGIETRSAAEEVRGQDLWIPIAEAAPLPPDRYYHYQIIGLRVRTAAGRDLGAVAEIMETGSNDVYVVRDDPAPDSGQAPREHLIPATWEVITNIDLAAGVMTITPLPGLLDEE